MVDQDLRSIFSPADETVAALDRLNQTDQAFRSRNLQRLESVVFGLDGPAVADEAPAPDRRRTADEDRRPAAPDPLPFVRLPTRTTHGGPFGPAVRDRLVREALERRRW